jgi:hypothetical protein
MGRVAVAVDTELNRRVAFKDIKPQYAGAAQAEDGHGPKPGGRRYWVQRAIKARRGQQAFRNRLRERYGDRCMATGCAILDALEAAHISPHRSPDDHYEENGLLLRADVHTLFDLDLLGIEPDELRVELHPDVRGEYASVVRDRLISPRDRRPARDALRHRYERFVERCELPL